MMVSTIATEISASDPAPGVGGTVHAEAAKPLDLENTPSAAEHAGGTDLLTSLLLICGKKPADAAASEWIAGIIAETDKRISAQINQILHHEAFRKLEGTWRAMRSLRC